MPLVSLQFWRLQCALCFNTVLKTLVCPLFQYSFEDCSVSLVSLQFWRLQCAPCFITVLKTTVCPLFHYSFEDYNVPLISLQFWRLQCAPCFISFEDYSVSFLAHLAKGHVSFCHHLRPSSVRLSYIVNFHILIFSSETTGPIATKLCWNGPWMAHFQNLSGDPDFQPRWPPS